MLRYKAASRGCLPSPTPCNYPYHQSGFACQLPPPLGEEALGVGVIFGDSQPKRLLPLEGAVAVRRLRVLGVGGYGGWGWLPPTPLLSAVPCVLGIPAFGTLSLLRRQLPPSEGAFAGGRSNRWSAKPLVTYLLSRLSAHANPGLGMQRNQLQHPLAGPHRDDRERRQIPVPFFGAA